MPLDRSGFLFSFLEFSPLSSLGDNTEYETLCIAMCVRYTCRWITWSMASAALGFYLALLERAFMQGQAHGCHTTSPPQRQGPTHCPTDAGSRGGTGKFMFAGSAHSPALCVGTSRLFSQWLQGSHICRFIPQGPQAAAGPAEVKDEYESNNPRHKAATSWRALEPLPRHPCAHFP